MAKRLLIEEFHVSFLVPRGLSEKEVRAIRTMLKSEKLRRLLKSSIADLIAHHRELSFRISW